MRHKSVLREVRQECKFSWLVLSLAVEVINSLRLSDASGQLVTTMERNLCPCTYYSRVTLGCKVPMPEHT